MKYGNILLFSIPSTLSTGHFNDYFIANSENLYLFLLPLSTQKPEVKLFYFHRGMKKSERSFFLYQGGNKIIRYIFFYLYYLYIIIKILPPKTIVLATTPQYCFLSSFFDFLKSIKIVYHVGDYYPHSKGLMKIYQAFIHYYNKRMKYVVYCSPLLESLLRTGKKKVDGNRDCWIFGIKKKDIKKATKCNLLGYIGVLRNGQGLEIIFDALKKNKKLKLEIIGEGPLFQNLKNTVSQFGLTDRITFWGLIQEEKKLMAIMRRWQIGLAPYDPNLLNMTYYGDPSKVKFYLEYKLPVIITKITYLYKEIEKYHAGVTIDYSASSLLEAIKKIQNKYDYYLDGVSFLVDRYEYNALYDTKFKFFRTIF